MLQIRVEDKETEVMEVVRNYINLDKECHTSGQNMSPIITVSYISYTAVSLLKTAIPELV